MRKRIITPVQTSIPDVEVNWLNLEELVEVELSSEDPAHPIESALLHGHDSGWRAAETGQQTIRLVFTSPQHLHRIWLKFVETTVERTQEYVLRWSADGGDTFHDIVRQQWNFNTPAATSQTEDYHVDLAGITALELTIIPNISGGNDIASLAQLKLA